MLHAVVGRFRLGWVLVLLVAALGWSETARAQSPAEGEITALMQRWSETYGSGTPDDMMALYAPDAVFWGTGGREPMTDPAAIRAYFATQFTNFPTRLPVELHNPVIRVYGEDQSATNTGTYTFRVTTAQGQLIQQTHRYSFAYAKIDGAWLIVHQHSSAIPQ